MKSTSLSLIVFMQIIISSLIFEVFVFIKYWYVALNGNLIQSRSAGMLHSLSPSLPSLSVNYRVFFER